MRHFLFKTTLVAGLVTSLASVAQTDLQSCLSDNSDKKDKITICLDQLHQQMGDARKQELLQKYNQAVSELNKPKQDTNKPATDKSASAAPSSNAPSGTANTGSSAASTETPANTNTATTPDSISTSPNTPTPEKKSVDVKPVPREKPTGVQWY